ncbi:MAG: hypothetical protein LC800_21745, partial [Acidobacteria bacterium]|nr:hypothetical protein [Acidobacteriota bacterium]
ADWSPDGQSFAVVRDVGGRNRLEYPVGNVLYETGGWISHPRFSPAGDLIGFIDHPTPADDSGSVAVVDLNKRKRKLSAGWISAQGLAWSRAGKEVWFTATKEGNARALHAVALGGEERLIYRGIGSLTLDDIAPDGCALVAREHTRVGIIGRAPGEARERDLSWHDWSLARDLSADGQTLLFTEAGEGGGATYGVYLRKTDGSPAVRLGDGSALALSPDGRWALAKLTTAPPRLVLLPTATGGPRLLGRAPLMYQPWACWLADNRRILFAASEPARGARLYVQNVEGGQPQCITPRIEGVELSSPHAISLDERVVAAVGPDREIYLYPLAGGEAQRVAGTEVDDLPVRWSADGDVLFVRQRGQVPVTIFRLDLATGGKDFWKQLMPTESAGVHEILRVLLTPHSEGYAYTYTRDLSDLYMVTGLK